MSTHRSVKHLDQYGAANLDTRTLHILYEDIEREVNALAALTKTVPADQRAWWDEMFVSESEALRAALATIHEELQARWERVGL